MAHDIGPFQTLVSFARRGGIWRSEVTPGGFNQDISRLNKAYRGPYTDFQVNGYSDLSSLPWTSIDSYARAFQSFEKENIGTPEDPEYVFHEINSVTVRGSNQFGQFGLGTVGDVSTWTDIFGYLETFPGSGVYEEVPLNVKTYALGVRHMIVVDINGTAWVAGDNTYGQLGLGNTFASLYLVPIVGNDWEKVGAGWYHTSAIKDDGTIYVWGNGVLTPQQRGVGNVFVAVSAGYDHILAIDGSGHLWRMTTSDTDFVLLENTRTYMQISAGFQRSSAITTDGDLWIGNQTALFYKVAGKWQYVSTSMYNRADIRGDHLANPRYTRAAISIYGVTYGVSDFAGVLLFDSVESEYLDLMADTTLFAKSDGRVLGTGRNDHGQLLLGDMVDRPYPVVTNKGRVYEVLGTEPDLRFPMFASDGDSMLWTDNRRALYGIGKNDYGQMSQGISTEDDYSVPVVAYYFEDVHPLDTLAGVSMGLGFGVVWTENGATFAWGKNDTYQCGRGNTDDTFSITQVLDSSDTPVSFQQVAAGGSHCVALDFSGNIWTWGDGSNGACGNGTTNPNVYPEPIVFDPPRTFVQVGAGLDFSVAIDDTGQVFTWGANAHGQLGNGGYGQALIPSFAIIANAQTIATHSRAQHVACITVDAFLYTWGLNTSGQLGTGTTIDSPTPAYITGAKRPGQCFVGAAHTGVISPTNDGKRKGKIRLWGSNFYGQTGVFTSIIPDIVPGLEYDRVRFSFDEVWGVE